ncbi:Short-chain dehydrogenase/reductase SDR [Neofusicoccum parvum]|uniref:Short-chain dehydrogenase/reductase SDR n=1 Tax=Neofusicoccum parvum TaxID=310453 RepID=A0ACB5S3K7_9PEZI|nr:Short-chain dehydrogenase/reductase SDR [Neofusicoccum parvum]
MAPGASETPMNYLVTGAARGIGRGLTRNLLRRGHRVFLLDANAAELENTLSLAPSWAPKPAASSPSPAAFQGQVVDLADRAQLKQAVAAASTFFNGKLDVLVNNAFATPHVWSGGRAMDDADDAIEREWDVKIAVGLTAPFLLSRLCVPLLTAAGEARGGGGRAGCVVNVSSTRARQAEPNHEAYSAAKAGLLGLTTSMAVSLGQAHGIRVNAVSPGWVDVDDENAAADQKGAKWGEALGEADHRWHPAGRVGRVEDVARAVVFLAESGFVTGEEVVLDGGVTRKMVYPEE